MAWPRTRSHRFDYYAIRHLCHYFMQLEEGYFEGTSTQLKAAISSIAASQSQSEREAKIKLLEKIIVFIIHRMFHRSLL